MKATKLSPHLNEKRTQAFRTITTNLKAAMLPWPLGTWRFKNDTGFSAGFFRNGEKGQQKQGGTISLGILAHLLRMVMELKYFAFRR